MLPVVKLPVTLNAVLIVCVAPIPVVVLERSTVLSVLNVKAFAEATAVTP